jgi:LysM repeat protein
VIPADNQSEKSVQPSYKPFSSYKHQRHETEYVDISNESRQVMTNNGVPYIIAKKGDTYEGIAKQYDVMTALIYKYNDVPKNTPVMDGEMVYIKPKGRSASQDFYTAKEGDSMQSISQQFGIKMKMLYKKNDMERGTEVQAGQKLWLKDRKPG